MNELRHALNRLESVMLERGMPHLDWLLPGLPPEESRDRLIQAGYPVTEEILTWFSWHNGAVDSNDVKGVNGRGAMGEGLQLLTLEQAIAEARVNEEVVDFNDMDDNPRIAQEYVDRPWVTRWLPILSRGNGTFVTADLATDPLVSPAIATDFEGRRIDFPQLPSLTALVTAYSDALSGHGVWKPREGMFEVIRETPKLEYRFL